MSDEISMDDALDRWYTPQTPQGDGAAMVVAVPTLPEQVREMIYHLEDVAKDPDATPQEKMQARSIWAKLLGK